MEKDFLYVLITANISTGILKKLYGNSQGQKHQDKHKKCCCNCVYVFFHAFPLLLTIAAVSHITRIAAKQHIP